MVIQNLNSPLDASRSSKTQHTSLRTRRVHFSPGDVTQQMKYDPTIVPLSSAGRKSNLDSGATTHMLKTSHKGTDEKFTRNGILIQFLSKEIVKSEATDKLQLPFVDEKAKECHKFQDDTIAESLLSVPQFSKSGCTTILAPNGATVLDPQGNVVLTGEFDTEKNAYLVDLDAQGIIQPATGPTTSSAPTPLAKAFASITTELTAVPNLILFYHAAAGFPVKETWIRAIERGYFLTWPGLTTSRVKKYLGKSKHTVNGHLKCIRQGAHSTKNHRRTRKHNLRLTVINNNELPEEPELTNQIASDLPGRFPITSQRGHKYMFLLYDIDSNYIHVVPMKSRRADEMVRAFAEAYQVLREQGFRANKIKLDNEISQQFKDHLKDYNDDITYELVSPGNHRSNPAERAIQDFKSHFISMLSGADESFPDNCWDLLLPQCNITLNLLRASSIQPKLSTYAQIHGNFDYNKTPLAPAGCKSIIHDRPNERPRWANHGTPGFYIGPALEHYRNYRCYVPTTRSQRTSDTVEFFPTTCRTPSLTKADRITMVLTDLQHVLSTQLPSSPYLEAGTVENKQLKHIHELLAVGPRVNPDISDVSDKNPRAKQTPTTTTAPQKGNAPPRVTSKRRQQPPRVASEANTEHTTQRNKRGKNTRELYPNGTIIRKQFPNGKHYEGEVVGYDEKEQWYLIQYLDGQTEDFNEADMRWYRKEKQKYAPKQYAERALSINEVMKGHWAPMISSNDSTPDQRADPRPCRLKPLAKYIVDSTLDMNFDNSAFPCPKTLKPKHRAMAAGGGHLGP